MSILKRLFSAKKESRLSAKMKSARREGLRLEALEDRLLLAVIPHGWGTYTLESGNTQVESSIQAGETHCDLNLYLGKQSGDIYLGVIASGANNTGFDPGKMEVRTTEGNLVSGAVIQSYLNYNGTTDSVVIIRLTPGTASDQQYVLRLYGEKSTTGDFVCNVFLPGNVNGNEPISTAELTRGTEYISAYSVWEQGDYTQATIDYYQTKYGIDITRYSGVYNSRYDVNMDGVLDSTDRTILVNGTGAVPKIDLKADENAPSGPFFIGTGVEWNNETPVVKDLATVQVRFMDDSRFNLETFRLYDAAGVEIDPALYQLREVREGGSNYLYVDNLFELLGIDAATPNGSYTFGYFVQDKYPDNPVLEGTQTFVWGAGSVAEMGSVGLADNVGKSVSLTTDMVLAGKELADQANATITKIAVTDRAPTGTSVVTTLDAAALAALTWTTNPGGSYAKFTTLGAGGTVYLYKNLAGEITGADYFVQTRWEKMRNLAAGEFDSASMQVWVDTATLTDQTWKYDFRVNGLYDRPEGNFDLSGTLDLRTDGTGWYAPNVITTGGIFSRDGLTLTVSSNYTFTVTKSGSSDARFTVTSADISVAANGQITIHNAQLLQTFLALYEGENVTLTLDAFVNDTVANYPSKVTWSVTGVNDAPTARPVSETVSYDEAAKLEIPLDATDPDTGDYTYLHGVKIDGVTYTVNLPTGTFTRSGNSPVTSVEVKFDYRGNGDESVGVYTIEDSKLYYTVNTTYLDWLKWNVPAGESAPIKMGGLEYQVIDAHNSVTVNRKTSGFAGVTFAFTGAFHPLENLDAPAQTVNKNTEPVEGWVELDKNITFQCGDDQTYTFTVTSITGLSGKNDLVGFFDFVAGKDGKISVRVKKEILDTIDDGTYTVHFNYAAGSDTGSGSFVLTVNSYILEIDPSNNDYGTVIGQNDVTAHTGEIAISGITIQDEPELSVVNVEFKTGAATLVGIASDTISDYSMSYPFGQWEQFLATVGSLLTIDAAGNYTFQNTNTDLFKFLRDGEILTLTYRYDLVNVTIRDAEGVETTYDGPFAGATITIQVSGVNDAILGSVADLDHQIMNLADDAELEAFTKNLVAGLTKWENVYIANTHDQFIVLSATGLMVPMPNGTEYQNVLHVTANSLKISDPEAFRAYLAALPMTYKTEGTYHGATIGFAVTVSDGETVEQTYAYTTNLYAVGLNKIAEPTDDPVSAEVSASEPNRGDNPSPNSVVIDWRSGFGADPNVKASEYLDTIAADAQTGEQEELALYSITLFDGHGVAQTHQISRTETSGPFTVYRNVGTVDSPAYVKVGYLQVDIVDGAQVLKFYSESDYATWELREENIESLPHELAVSFSYRVRDIVLNEDGSENDLFAVSASQTANVTILGQYDSILLQNVSDQLIWNKAPAVDEWVALRHRVTFDFDFGLSYTFTVEITDSGGNLVANPENYLKIVDNQDGTATVYLKKTGELIDLSNGEYTVSFTTTPDGATTGEGSFALNITEKSPAEVEDYTFDTPIAENATDEAGKLTVDLYENAVVTDPDNGNAPVDSFLVADAVSMVPTGILLVAKDGSTYSGKAALMSYWNISEAQFDQLIVAISGMAKIESGVFTFQNEVGDGRVYVLNLLRSWGVSVERETLELTFGYTITEYVSNGITYDIPSEGFVELSIVGVNNLPQGLVNYTETTNQAKIDLGAGGWDRFVDVMDGVWDAERPSDTLGVTISVSATFVTPGFTYPTGAITLVGSEVAFSTGGLAALREAFKTLGVGEKAYFTLTYTVTDGDGGVSTATVQFEVVNTTPVAKDLDLKESNPIHPISEAAGTVLFDLNTYNFTWNPNAQLDRTRLWINTGTTASPSWTLLTQGGSAATLSSGATLRIDATGKLTYQAAASEKYTPVGTSHFDSIEFKGVGTNSTESYNVGTISVKIVGEYVAPYKIKDIEAQVGNFANSVTITLSEYFGGAIAGYDVTVNGMGKILDTSKGDNGNGYTIVGDVMTIYMVKEYKLTPSGGSFNTDDYSPLSITIRAYDDQVAPARSAPTTFSLSLAEEYTANISLVATNTPSGLTYQEVPQDNRDMNQDWFFLEVWIKDISVLLSGDAQAWIYGITVQFDYSVAMASGQIIEVTGTRNVSNPLLGAQTDGFTPIAINKLSYYDDGTNKLVKAFSIAYEDLSDHSNSGYYLGGSGDAYLLYRLKVVMSDKGLNPYINAVPGEAKGWDYGRYTNNSARNEIYVNETQVRCAKSIGIPGTSGMIGLKRTDVYVDGGIYVRAVTSKTETDPLGKVQTLSNSADYMHEWQTHYAEIWIKASDLDYYLAAGVTLNYNVNLFTAVDIEFGSAFENGSYTFENGRVSGISASVKGDATGSGYILLARVKFESGGEQGIAWENSATPESLLWNLSDGWVSTSEGRIESELGVTPATEVWAVPYDVNDDGAVSLADFTLFARYYATTSLNGGLSEYLLDYNRDGAISLADFSLFVGAYGIAKADVVSGKTQLRLSESFRQRYVGALDTDDTRHIGTILDAANQAWAEALGLSETISVTLVVKNLGGDLLAQAQITKLDSATGSPTHGTIYLDDDAAGNLWFSQLYAPTAGNTRYDLYTVLLHELGHLYGYDESYGGFAAVTERFGELLDGGHSTDANDLMYAGIGVGTRKNLTDNDITVVETAQAAAYADPTLRTIAIGSATPVVGLPTMASMTSIDLMPPIGMVDAGGVDAGFVELSTGAGNSAVMTRFSPNAGELAVGLGLDAAAQQTLRTLGLDIENVFVLAPANSPLVRDRVLEDLFVGDETDSYEGDFGFDFTQRDKSATDFSSVDEFFAEVELS